MSELFRAEVVEHEQNARYGSVRLISPPGRTLYVCILLLFLLALALFLFFGSYTRRVTVTGEIATANGLVLLQSERPGVVSGVFVKQGDHVRKGQALVALVSGDSISGFGNLSEKMLEEISSQRASLEAQAASSVKNYDIKARELRIGIAALYAKQEKIEQQAALVDQQIKMLTDRQTKFDDLLSDGFITRLQADQGRSDLLSAKLQSKTLQLQIFDIQSQVASNNSELASLPVQSRLRTDELRAQLSQARQQELQTRLNGNWDSVSPIDGIVTAVSVKGGQAVQTGQPLFAVMPLNAKLEADIQVTDSAAGFVEPGQRLLLRLPAFPFQRFGQLPATVVSVDRTPSVRGSQGGESASGPGTYHAVARLEAQTIVSGNVNHPLLPGMTFEADLLLERRRLIDWLIAPLVGFKQRNLDSGERE